MLKKFQHDRKSVKLSIIDIGFDRYKQLPHKALRMKTCILTIFFPFFIALCFVSYGYAEKSILSIDVKDSIIELKTEKIPLGDIVKAIAERAGISITFDESITELFSIHFKGSIEECLKLLLKQKNYMMIYDEKGNGQRVLSEVFLISPGTKVRYGNRTDSPENSMIRNAGDWFKREFAEGKALLHLVSATPSSGGADRGGIEITVLPGNSPFHKIGLEEGDVVIDVNGTPVTTVEEFIQALQSVSKERPNIRIDRRKSDGTVDPIYIDVK